MMNNPQEFKLTKIPSEDAKELQFIIDEEGGKEHVLLEFKKWKWGIRTDTLAKNIKIGSINKYNLFFVGCSESVVGISKETGVIKFALGLLDQFSFFLEDESRIIIATETFIIVINASNCS